MPGFPGLVNWIRAGISFSQDPNISCTSSDTLRPQDDVMMDSTPPPDAPADPWDHLKALAQSLRARDPNTLTPFESVLLRAVHLHYEIEEAKRKCNCPKECGSLVDITMEPPPSTHQRQSSPLQSYRPSPPILQPLSSSTSSFIPFEQDHAARPEDTDVVDNVTAFINVRHHPYHRLAARGQPLPGLIPSWVKKKTSLRTIKPREAQAERDSQEKFGQKSDYWSRVEAKGADLLSRARRQVEETGGQWDGDAYVKRFGSQLRETAERLVNEEDIYSSRSVNDEHFARAIDFITASGKQQVETLAQDEEHIKLEIQAVRELDQVIEVLYAELRRRRMERRHYPTNPKVLDDKLKETISRKETIIKHQEDLVSGLDFLRDQHGQDFFTAWRALQVQFGLSPNLWPSGVFPPTVPCTQSSTQASFPACDTVPSAYVEPESQQDPILASMGLSPHSPFPSTSSNPSPRISRPFNYTYLTSKRPRTDAERISRYEADWALLRSSELRDGHATFEQMPWPVLFDLKKDQLDKLDVQSIRDFILHPSRNTEAKAVKHQELLRWHTDKINQILSKFVSEDRSAIVTASKQISICLIDIYKSL